MKGIVLVLAAMILTTLVIGFTASETIDDESDCAEDLVIKTLGSPVEIWTLDDLNDIRNDLNGHYILMDDINASETVGWNSGAGWAPIGTLSVPFEGTLDGNNHTIMGLFIYRPSYPSGDNVGLFGATSTSSLIKDIGILDIQIHGRSYVGGLVGQNHGNITRAYAEGNISCENRNVGLLIGINHGNVTYSNSTGNVHGGDCSSCSQHIGGLIGGNAGNVGQSYSTANVSGPLDVGGLVGVNWKSVSQCYATGNVMGYDSAQRCGGLVGLNHVMVTDSYANGDVTGNYSGGLLGENSGTVTNTYSTGNVSGDYDIGGLVGHRFSSPVENSYWDIDSSNISYSSVGEGKTTSEMMEQDTFIDWDFENIWWIMEDGTRPLLRCFINVVDINITNIAIETYPDDTVFNFADGLNLNGMTVNLTKSDGSYEVIPWNDPTLTIVPSNGSTLTHDDTNISITHFGSGKRTNFTIIVNPVVIGLSIHEIPHRIEYNNGEDLDLGGLVVNLTWSNDLVDTVSFEDFGENITTAPLNSTIVTHANKIVTVTHLESGETAEFNVTINRSVTAVWVLQQPQLVYNCSELLNLSKLEVNLTWSDIGNETVAYEDFGDNDLVTNLASSSQLNHSHDGLRIQVTHTMGGESVQTEPLLIHPVVSGVAIAQQPQLIYVFDQPMNLSVMKVNLTWTNGSSETIDFNDFATNGLIADLVDGTSVNHTHHMSNITITHVESGEVAYSGYIQVESNVLKVWIVQDPQLVYNCTDPLNLSLLKVNLTWSDTGNETVSFEDFSSYGIIVDLQCNGVLNHSHQGMGINVTHMPSGETAKTSALHIDAVLVSISVCEQPLLYYNESDALDLKGLKVMMEWSNGSNCIIDFEDFSDNGLMTSLSQGIFLFHGQNGTVITVMHMPTGMSAHTSPLQINEAENNVLLGLLALLLICAVPALWFIRRGRRDNYDISEEGFIDDLGWDD